MTMRSKAQREPSEFHSEGPGSIPGDRSTEPTGPAGGVTFAVASHHASTYAVEHWHYSRSMPAGKLVRVGVWEDGKFIGVVLFGRGASRRLGQRYRLDQTQFCELVRVAMRPHDTPTSSLVAGAIKLLQHSNPGLRLVISFADEAQGHVGTLYQAGNWIYTGDVTCPKIIVRGQPIHLRSAATKWGTCSVEWLREHVDPECHAQKMPPKHRYLMPLDRSMRRQVEKLRLPYPTKQQVSVG